MTPFAVLFAATLAVPAQSAPVDPLGGSSPAASRAMAEDVETMRYVLSRKLAGFATGVPTWSGSFFPSQNAYSAMPALAAQGVAAPSNVSTTHDSNLGQWAGRGFAAQVEGLYLPRIGVLFTVTLPPTKGDPRMKSEAPSKAEPLGDWERAKMIIDGKTPPANQPASRREIPLAEVLLKALADNGKHFRELRDDERIMVVATFRRSAENSDPFAPALSLYSAALAPRATNIAPAAPGQAPASSPGLAGAGGGESDYDALADIHLKRGDYARAIEAYAAAVKKAAKELDAADDAGRTEALKRARLAYAKLGQAHMSAGQFEQAKAVLDSASKLEDKGRGTPSATTKPATPPLPSRLTISATKRDLVAAASGKLSMEELGKLASVEFSDPSATK